MTDLIDRQAAIEVLRSRWLKTRNYEGIGEDIAEECEIYLKTLPSAQPEIIHCRDCKYWNPYSMECEGIGNWFGFEGAWEENGYCYKAERRNDG